MSYSSNLLKLPLLSVPAVVRHTYQRKVALRVVWSVLLVYSLVGSVSYVVSWSRFVSATKADLEVLRSTPEYADKEICVLSQEVFQNECNTKFTTLGDDIKGSYITVNGQLVQNDAQAIIACHSGANRVSHVYNVTDESDEAK